MKKNVAAKKMDDGLSRVGALRWKLEAGRLCIGGSGWMRDFTDRELAPWAEDREKIRQVYVEDGVVNIGGRAFVGYPALEKVVLAGSVERIGWRAFDGCGKLARLETPRQLQNWRLPGENTTLTVGFRALRGTQVQQEPMLIRDGVLLEYNGTEREVTVPEGVTGIAPYAFEGCPVEAVRLPRGLTTIGDAAFYGAKLERLVVPDSVTRIGAHAFGGNRLKTLELSKELTFLGDRAFAENPELCTVWLGNLKACFAESAFEETPVCEWDERRIGRWLLAMPEDKMEKEKFHWIRRQGRWSVANLVKLLREGAVILCLYVDEDNSISLCSHCLTKAGYVREYWPYPYLAKEGGMGETAVKAATVEQWQKRFRDEDTWLSLLDEGTDILELEEMEYILSRKKRSVRRYGTRMYFSWDRGNFWGPLELRLAKEFLLENPQCYAGSLCPETED